MSTKYILPSGRDAVHAALLKPINSCIFALLLASDPQLVIDPERLKSSAKMFAVPLVEQLVAILEGNAEGANDILRASVKRESAAHEERMKADTAKLLHEMVDAIFADPSTLFGEKTGPKTATEEGRERRMSDDLADIADRAKDPAWLARALGIDPNTLRKVG